jgi:hypothetical protein
MGSKGSAAKAGGRLEPPSTLAPCCAGSTATVGSRVCDFACSTDAGVKLPTSLTRPVTTSDAERPLALAVKEPASSRGRPPPLSWSCAVEGHPSAVLSRSVRMCCLSNSYSRTDKRPRSSSSTTRSSFTNGSSVSLAALPSWAAVRRGRPSLYGATKSCCCPGMFRFPVSGSGRFFPPQLGISWQGGRRLTLQERAPCDCVPQSLSRGASTADAAVLERKGGYPTVQKFASAAARCRFGAAGRVARSPAASGVRHVVVCARQRHQRPALPLLSGPTASIFPTNLC